MTDVEFDYTEVLKTDTSDVVVNVVAHQTISNSPLRAVLWSSLHHAWIFAPGPAARLLYDDRNFDRLRGIDRATAERAAREQLQKELPSEAELQTICDEGERMGWDNGPPRR